VIQAGARLMDVVPSGSPLIAEARLKLTDVNEVTPGRKADVRMTSINRTERPQISGEVMTVSADRITDQRTGEGYYAVRVRLDQSEVSNSRVSLQAGMPTEIIIPTRPRTLFEYLLSPLADEITGAFREH
jgi:multidrug efflux pump subunit AcrA (membrane-fusion protein)